MNFKVARAPLRVSLVGGGTDIPSFYEKYGGAVLSFAIDKYVYVAVKSLPSLFPYKYKLAYSRTELCNKPDEIKHPIIREVIKRYNIHSLDMTSMADIPAGTGLGSSSAFTVALIKALNPTFTKHELAKEACAIEIDTLNEPIGKQDQYASSFGGVNYITFDKTGIRVYPLDISSNLLSSNCHLFYTGTARSASKQLSKQKIDMPRDLAPSALCYLKEGDFEKLGLKVSEGWEAKKAQGKDVSNTTIDYDISYARSNGAYGAKLLGAGGGGFILTIGPYPKSWIGHLEPQPYAIDNDGAKII